MQPGNAASTVSNASTPIRDASPSFIDHSPPTPSYQPREDRPTPSPKRCKTSHPERHHVPDLSRVSWPADRIPVEIYDIITSYLARAEVKTLRLVCREFDNKISRSFFRNVVVPFRSELYSTSSRGGAGTRQRPGSALRSNGMRIFESFGPHILRFALSLEIDEDALALPPVKPTQTAQPSFWGIYRWPHESYNRYSDLGSIEDAADETTAMTEGLRHLTSVVNLGLCCDAGLGFLIRPDPVARNAACQQPVFPTYHRRRERRPALRDDRDRSITTIADFNGVWRYRTRDCADSVRFKYAVLEKMVMNAGYPKGQADEAVRLLLETERTSLSSIDFSGHGETPSHEALLEWVWDPITNSDVCRCPPHLIPTKLTRSQKELLLELDWAHRAMIHSYVVAMINNASAGHLNSLTTLSIAKIPSSHLHILCRRDFWESFPNLTNVLLGVVADWRRISKPDASEHIEDDRVSPVEAVGKAYRLLNSFIAKQPRIESLHFEWVCGGEFAPSFAQRNMYILPAPFLEEPTDMNEDRTAINGKLLCLPHVKHFSLKNCWVSPQVFIQTVRQMGLASLEKLELESVSLSQRPVRNMPFDPLAANFVGTVPPAWPSTDNFENPPQSPSLPAEARLPEVLTWSGILEHFSPSLNIRKHADTQGGDIVSRQEIWESRIRSARGYLPDASGLAADEKRYKLRCLSLKSCGYTGAISSRMDSNEVMQAFQFQQLGHHVPSTTDLDEWQPEVQKYMQECRDWRLGRIVPSIHQEEHGRLTGVFGMTMGWRGIYSERMIQEAVADGIIHPGKGRFSGVLESTDPKPRTASLSDDESDDAWDHSRDL
ncbi:hypothetical protein ACRE_087000 [Hapsidospora chrysogenum ATCC 11550]|uniref:F-box domain-containing protein n=1 Tax=Hapsidospora chrysogenum (strain ATCC 11550 / CBS 779.69 / DSM 880 / IAM 14645 / JCM 23072 / IMI 49137) TaxID=857340 RepID=A0A086SU20_HAPC1|nr:hypothetical protein ACRE_087000 [Hapsidospora chrysogenum ATCC 11550]